MKKLVWLDERDALVLHDRLLALHGGAPGVRDAGLLASALARPRHHAAYGDDPDIILLAALYTTGIVRNHPFVDGNKRTGFVLGIVFLELNGHIFTASEEEAARAVIALASGAIDESGYAVFLRDNARPTRKKP
jgi:death-on-curing protein